MIKLPFKKKYPGRGPTIALLGDELNYEIPIKIFNTIKELVRENNYDLLYIAGEAYKSPIEFYAQSNILYNLITSRAVEGLITISSLLSAYSSPRKFYKRYLELHSLPVISLGISFEGIPSVVLDNTTGMYEAVNHLIEDHHYTRIAFLSGTPDHPDVIERLSAFTHAMEAHDLPVEQSLLLRGNFQIASGSMAVRELLDTRGKKPGRDVQAIVCCNDYMASGVLLELQARSISIPEEIALGGEKAKLKGLDLGAVDYIEKPFLIKELTAKIKSITALRQRQEKQELSYIQSTIDKVFSGFQKGITQSGKPGFNALCKKYKINNREQKMIQLMLSGLMHKEIASKLNISKRTVDYHLAKIYKKCGVKNKFTLLNKFQG